jgi:hypothetical protein
LRLGAPLNGDELLDHQRQRQGRQHIQMLLQALQHGPDRNDLGQHADQGASREGEHEADDGRASEHVDERRPEHAAEHAELPAVKLMTREAENITL